MALVLIGSLFFAAPAGLASESLADRPLNGRDAIDRAGAEIERIARLNGLTTDRLVSLLETDPYLYLNSDGAALYMDPAPTEPADDAPPPEIAFITVAEAFSLNSKPGSNRTVYLDFNGHTVTDTTWNGTGGVPNGYYAPPFDLDGNPGSWSSQELTVIAGVWARVAEDYAPFDVNVTTRYPGESAITRSGAGDQVYGTRIAITNAPPGGFCNGCGGIAYIGVFARTSNHAYYQPAWCFAGSYGASAKNLAECASHEVGHNVGLYHDGREAVTYYSGHNTWGPIMGTAYNQPVSQWSKGEYNGATNTEDDFAIMGNNGLSLRSDDHGNSTGAASAFGGMSEGFITSSSDSDYFRFVAGASGTATFHAAPKGTGPNLDLALTLYNSSGAQLAHADPVAARQSASVATGLDATIQHTVSNGQVYYLRVTGTGHGSPMSDPPTGYTSYGSVGPYTLTVSGVRSAEKSDSVGVVDPTTGQWYLRDAATGLTTSFYYGVPGDLPFMGDWDGDGIDTPGLYRQSTGLVYLRNSNTTGSADHTFIFGNPGDIPIVGDWDGDGKDTVSVYRSSTGQVFIINSLPPDGGSPVASISYYFGNPGDKPFAGDFDGDGIDTVGLHRESTGLVYFRNTHGTGAAHAEFFYGNPGDYILAGRWKPGATTDTVGIYRPSHKWFYLRFANTQGVANVEFPYGNSKLRTVSGYIGSPPGGSAPPPSN